MAKKRIKSADGIWLKAREAYYVYYHGKIVEWHVLEDFGGNVFLLGDASEAFYEKERCAQYAINKLNQQIGVLMASRSEMERVIDEERAKGGTQ